MGNASACGGVEDLSVALAGSNSSIMLGALYE